MRVNRVSRLGDGRHGRINGIVLKIIRKLAY